MRKRFLSLALVLAAGLAAAPPFAPAPAQRKAAPRDWTRTVVATPEGGFRMGNPAARVKLIEYGSLTCPHCANFARAGMAPLKAAYVRSGRVSFEYRSLVLNGVDVTATLLARCAGPAGFFRVVENMYATQPAWLGRATGLTEAQRRDIQALPEGQRYGRVADLAGLTQLAAQHGVPARQGKACLANRAAFDRLGRLAQAANQIGINHTPTFLINGVEVHAHSWAELEPLIKRAGG